MKRERPDQEGIIRLFPGNPENPFPPLFAEHRANSHSALFGKFGNSFLSFTWLGERQERISEFSESSEFCVKAGITDLPDETGTAGSTSDYLAFSGKSGKSVPPAFPKQRANSNSALFGSSVIRSCRCRADCQPMPDGVARPERPSSNT